MNQTLSNLVSEQSSHFAIDLSFAAHPAPVQRELYPITSTTSNMSLACLPAWVYCAWMISEVMDVQCSDPHCDLLAIESGNLLCDPFCLPNMTGDRTPATGEN